ncbi:LuxR family transcriptional regulator [Candidatus Magnetomorum sp. HK-1]|nr:LuxR family transcriptional regulator [Candidatus Magnetomorum sp. HK-1]
MCIESPTHVLIVDDNLGDLEFLKIILETDDFVVDMTDNPIKALDLIDPEKHELVLLDIDMPQMNGFNFAIELKKKVDCQRIPIIFISGMKLKDHIQKAFQVGAQDYIQKPIAPFEVIARVKLRIQQARQLKQLNADHLTNKHFDSKELTDNEEESFINKYFMVLNDILPRLNLLKEQKMSWSHQKKIIDAIENDLTLNSSIVTQKMKHFRLSISEIRIVMFLITGLSSKEIAQSLGLSFQTIKTHRKNIRKKMGLTNKQTSIIDCLLDL